MLGIEEFSAIEKQGGDTPERLGPLFRGAVLDHFFQFGEQRRRGTHYTTHTNGRWNPLYPAALRKFKLDL
jgi:hypothetical protein